MRKNAPIGEQVMTLARQSFEETGLMPNYADLAQAIGTSPTAVWREIKRLDAQGRLRILHRSGRGRSRFTFPPGHFTAVYHGPQEGEKTS